MAISRLSCRHWSQIGHFPSPPTSSAPYTIPLLWSQPLASVAPAQHPPRQTSGLASVPHGSGTSDVQWPPKVSVQGQGTGPCAALAPTMTQCSKLGVWRIYDEGRCLGSFSSSKSISSTWTCAGGGFSYSVPPSGFLLHKFLLLQHPMARSPTGQPLLSHVVLHLAPAGFI